MEMCRLCLGIDDDHGYQKIMQGDFKIALEMDFVCGINVIETCQSAPAVVCSKCVEGLSQAVQLKKIALLADSFFRKQTKEVEADYYNEFKDECVIIVEALEEDDYSEVVKNEGSSSQEILEEITYERVEYDEMIECEEEVFLENVSQQFIEVKPYIDDSETKPKLTRKSYKPRNVDGSRRIHQCHCGIVFSSDLRLRNHIRVKHEFVPESDLLPCSLCDKKFKIKEYLDLHLRNKHSNYPLKARQKTPCTICGKILSSLVALRNHEEKHLLELHPGMQVKKFVCDYCGQSFRMKSYLFNHMHNIHFRRKYPCAICSKGFYKKYEMHDHVRTAHTLETPFHCEYEGCLKSFSRKKNYLIHARIHTGERPYKCTYCEKAFIHFIDRKRHIMKHTGERPHVCEDCQKGFMRKNDLAEHKKSHLIKYFAD